MTKIERRIADYISNNLIKISVIIFSIIAVVIRFQAIDYESGDFTYFLDPWMKELKANGGISGIANYSGDYNAPYVTLLALLTYINIPHIYTIKILSIIFDFALAVSCGYLIKCVVKENKSFYFALTYIIVLFLPNVLMNSAMWGQCDAIYSTFVILALVFLIKDKPIPSFIMLGIAFAFKLQFIFILPLYIVLYLCKRNFSILHFLIIPLVNIVMCLPAIIAGKPITDCFLVYANQTQTYNEQLVQNFPNLYNVFVSPVDMFYNVGILLTVVACGLMLFFCIYKKVEFNQEKILYLGLWFLIIVTYLLPGMHERYLFVGEVLSVILFIAYRKFGYMALLVNLISIFTYVFFLIMKINIYGYILFGLSIIYGMVIIYFTKNIIKLLVSKEENMIKS